jgi:hypothetical protein
MLPRRFSGLGRSQAVRQRILIPPFGGSIPPAPASFRRILADHYRRRDRAAIDQRRHDRAIVDAQAGQIANLRLTEDLRH